MVTNVETLHPVEIRVLGALIEKDITTPEYYPLTVNSLQNACNQKSSRDPVVQFDEQTVEQALEMLRNKHLVIRISGTGHRVEKWGHRLGETKPRPEGDGAPLRADAARAANRRRTAWADGADARI
jgi:uncharacterized protein YceH (UPF0502 family)